MKYVVSTVAGHEVQEQHHHKAKNHPLRQCGGCVTPRSG